jgi:hypothetical protein
MSEVMSDPQGVLRGKRVTDMGNGADQPTVPAGWHPDPAGSGQLRWWDGVAWTVHLTEPQPIAPTVVRTPEPTYVPFQSNVQRSYEFEAAPPLSSNTLWIWLFICTPLLGFAFAWISLPRLVGATGTEPASYVVGFVVGIALTPFGGLLLLAIFGTLDRRALARRGFVRPASTWWILLTPLAYLIARSVKMRGMPRSLWAPLWTYLAISVIAGVIFGLSSAALLPQLAAQNSMHSTASIARGIQDGMNQNGRSFVVTCPPTVSTVPGTKFACSALEASTGTRETFVLEFTTGSDGKTTIKLDSTSQG